MSAPARRIDVRVSRTAARSSSAPAAAAAAGMLDERTAVLEALTSIRRAGADIVITYHAKDAARWM